ncbi:LacI family DNA-binding transcriptional regulator [Mesorhizobium mediterraneum]|uniref:LacI family transcriptional regulator n=1 Tax=Mesorhizobium mediterraneum TaxID=43617 RepID=A0AB36R896_9HYPH|nr:LacI family DNA-binding transcriptional regulator [Mesorhizobium mediterraneum]PAQ01072.1 LacI family transcriptional regulator [Mesorhizobium mediterraneum]RWN41108.1 MAG: LacI family DNA-binding transcriptional regulator [Mesorhizobium sp.]WIW52144.1 LacI family DNA-binding transcriptional regulator [Mesorhizobium mediterraneum]
MASSTEGNTRPIRLADIAKAAGVSHGTASNVFSRPEIVREEVRERVKAAAEAMGYAGPDPKGRLLRAGKVNAIGVATTEPLSYFFDDPFARTMMAGISEACDATGAGIALVSAGNEEKLAWNIQSALVDGFILFCIEGGPRLVELTRERKLPFVALELGSEDDTVSAIGVDNVAGARLAAQHLAELGHRRFAVLALPFADDSTGLVSPEQIRTAAYTGTRDRLVGYFEALSRFGVDTAGIPVYETENDEASTRAGLEAIFAGGEPPTAILAMSDRMAMVAIEWLTARGIAVPGDVSVVGFDGVPEAALSIPALTTIAQPIAEIGRRAARMILDFDGTVRRETLGVELVVRASSGPPPKTA